MDLDRIERYMNRELHPAAARAMAHEALDDSDLFEELTAVALVRAALESPATTDRAWPTALATTICLTPWSRAASRKRPYGFPAAQLWPIAAAAGGGGGSAHVLCACGHLSRIPMQEPSRLRNRVRGFAHSELKPRGRIDAPYFEESIQPAVPEVRRRHRCGRRRRRDRQPRIARRPGQRNRTG